MAFLLIPAAVSLVSAIIGGVTIGGMVASSKNATIE